MQGDYNINYDKAMLSQATADYINHIASLGCIQLIDKLTRISQTSNTVLLCADKNLEYLKKKVKMNFAKLNTG